MEHLQTCTGHTGRVYSVAYSPDGKTIASGSGDKTVRIWNGQTGSPLQTLTGHTGGVDSVAYSPDGKKIAGGGYDGKIRIWDVETGAPLRTLSDWQHGSGRVYSVAYSPDGKTIASGSDDTKIRIWNERDTRAPLLTLTGHTRMGFFRDVFSGWQNTR